MHLLTVPYTLTFLIGFYILKTKEKQRKFELIEANNILLATTGFIRIGFVLYMLYIEGNLSDQMAFYNRSTGSILPWLKVLLAPITFDITTQILWAKVCRKNLILSYCFMAILGYMLYTAWHLDPYSNTSLFPLDFGINTNIALELSIVITIATLIYLGLVILLYVSIFFIKRTD